MKAGCMPATSALRQRARPPTWQLGLLLLGGLAVAAVVAVSIDRLAFQGGSQASRPDLQQVIQGLVAGQSQIAPGATAYIAGPNGIWLGAAGVADTTTGAPMTPDARMRLESVSKIYTATLILQLAQEGKLRVGDTVASWLPGLLPYGGRITIRQLLTMRSGLIDNNDLVNAPESEQRTYLARVKDAKLRAQILEIAARVNAKPETTFSPIWWIRWATWQPLLFAPGTQYHYSNIGYDVLGLIAARAGKAPLDELYRVRISSRSVSGQRVTTRRGRSPGLTLAAMGSSPTAAKLDRATGTPASEPRAASSPTQGTRQPSSQRSCKASSFGPGG